MALIQKLQRGKAIPGGANKVSEIKDFDSFVGAVMYGGPEATKIPYTFTSKSEEAIRRDWDSFRKLESELSKKNLKIEDVFRYDPVTRKHEVNQDKVKELEASEDFDPNTLKTIFESAPKEGVKTYALSGIRTTRDGIAALLDLKIAYNDYINKPKPAASSASWASAFPTPSSSSTTGYEPREFTPKDPYLDLAANATNYAAMTEDEKKDEMFHRGRSRINSHLEQFTNAKNPDVLALRDFYKNNETVTPDNWNTFKRLAGRLDWTVNFSTPDASSGDSETKTYQVDDDLYTSLRQANATIAQTGENEYDVEGLTEPFLYNDKILYETSNGKWTLVDKNSAPNSIKSWVKGKKVSSEDLFTTSKDKVIPRLEAQKPITILGKQYSSFINLTPNTTLPDGSEFLLTEQVFDEFGNSKQLIGNVIQNNRRWNVVYNLREDGTYGVNPSRDTNFPENVRSFKINTNPDGRPVKYTDFTFTGIDQEVATKVEGLDLSKVKPLAVRYSSFYENMEDADPDILYQYLKWFQNPKSAPLSSRVDPWTYGWTPDKINKAVQAIKTKLGVDSEDVEKKQLGGIILADLKKEEEVEEPKVIEPTKNPNERALASMDSTDKWLLGADVAATGLSMAGGVAGVVGGLALLASGVTQGVRNDDSLMDITKNAAINLGFAAMAFVPGMSAFRAAKGAKSLLSATKTAKVVGEAAKAAKTAKLAKLAKVSKETLVAREALVAEEVARLTKEAVGAGKVVSRAEKASIIEKANRAANGLDEAFSGINELDEVIKLGRSNINNAITLLSTSKNKTVQVERAISNLEKAKKSITPNFVNQIVTGGPILKGISLVTRGYLVTDGLMNGIPAALKIADVTWDEMRGEDVNFTHVITEGDLRNTLRLAGASKVLKQFANQGLVRLGTASTTKPTAVVKTDKVVAKAGETSKIGATAKNTLNTVKDAGKNTTAKIKDTTTNLFGSNDRVLKPSSIDDGWFTTLAKSRATKFGYTKQGFNPNLNEALTKRGMFEKGKLNDDLIKTINELLNK